MASLSPSAKQQFLTNAGQIASGFSLYTYVSGTTTPLATYQDAATTSANTNPIVLDARGEAIIYLLPQLYRYVLKDSVGATIWTRDNIASGISASDLASTATGKGGDQVGFKQAGGSAKARTVQKKQQERLTLFDFIEPQDHAAITGGTASNEYSSQIQAAIAQSITSSVTCNANGGIFPVSSPILVVTGLTLVGAGRARTTFKLASGADTSAIAIDPSVTGSLVAALCDFQVDGNKANQTDGTKAIIDLSNPVAGSSRLLVDRIYSRNAKGVGFRALDFNRDSIFRGITVYGADGDGFVASTADSIFDQINVGMSGKRGFVMARSGMLGVIKSWRSGEIDSANGHGFEISAPAVIAASLWAQDNAGHGLYINGTTASGSECCSVRLLSENSGSSGVRIDTANYNRVDIICRDRTGGTYTHSRGVYYQNGAANNEVYLTNQTSAVSVQVNADADSNKTSLAKRRDQDKTYAFTYSCNALDAEVFRSTLAGGNVSVQAPSNAIKGMEIEFQFTQDGTGGRTMTFNAVFKVNWTPDTSAGKLNIIRFRYNGTNWVQISATVGL